MTAEPKPALRESVLRRREALPEAERAESSRRIVARILDLRPYERSSVVLAYASFGTELETADFLIRVLGDGKNLVLPRVERGRLGLFEVRDPARDLAPGPWGIREPIPDRCPAVDPGSINFALIPGVAFDRTGGRLGYGAGFYDRLLAGGLADNAPLVSGAFEVQIVDRVPVDPHDVSVDVVVTEARVYSRNGGPETS